MEALKTHLKGLHGQRLEEMNALSTSPFMAMTTIPMRARMGRMMSFQAMVVSITVHFTSWPRTNVMIGTQHFDDGTQHGRVSCSHVASFPDMAQESFDYNLRYLRAQCSTSLCYTRDSNNWRGRGSTQDLSLP